MVTPTVSPVSVSALPPKPTAKRRPGSVCRPAAKLATASRYVVSSRSPRRAAFRSSFTTTNAPIESASGPVTRLGCRVVTTYVTSKWSPTVSRGIGFTRVSMRSGPGAGAAAGADAPAPAGAAAAAGADAASAIVRASEPLLRASEPLVRASEASVMSVKPSGAELEELVQLGREVLVGPERDAVDPELREQAVAPRFLIAHVLLVTLAQNGAPSVDGHALAGLHVLQVHQAHARQLALGGVGDRHGHHVVTPRRDPERDAHALGRAAGAQEVADQEHDRLLLQQVHHELQRLDRVRASPRRLEQQDVADQAHHVLLALPRRDEALDVVGEEQQPHLVVVRDRRERDRRRHLRRLLELELRPRAEVARPRGVDAQDDGQLALLDELLHERLVHARGDLPVDRANVVAGQVLAHVDELHPLTLERGLVLAHERGVDDLPGVELDAAQLLQELSGQHRSRHFDGGEDLLDDVVGRHLLRFGLVAQDDAVA